MKKTDRFEASAAGTMLFYQSVYSFQSSLGIEAAFRGNIRGPMQWQAGLRLGLNPVLPEGFARLLVVQKVGKWQPSAGIELGLTKRAYFDDGEALLRESREAMRTDINSLYISGHAAPLSFKVADAWRISVMELDIGTHLSHIGRTIRVQVYLVSVGITF
jgi:hypothetical protein